MRGMAVNLVIAASIFSALALISVLAFLISRIRFGGADLPLTSEWINDISLDRYSPMVHMLDGADIELLCSQPGFTPGMAKKLRTQRTKAFRGYLRSLETDFGRICSAIKLVMLHSKHDRPELAEALIRQQVKFAYAMLSVRWYLFLYSLGICGVEVSRLVKIFDGMRFELRLMVPPAG